MDLTYLTLNGDIKLNISPNWQFRYKIFSLYLTNLLVGNFANYYLICDYYGIINNEWFVMHGLLPFEISKLGEILSTKPPSGDSNFGGTVTYSIAMHISVSLVACHCHIYVNI